MKKPDTRKRCSRCYGFEGSVSFTNDNKKCDTCIYEQEVLKASSKRAEASPDHHEMMMLLKPKGDPILAVSLRKGLDYDIVAEMCEASRVVCKHQRRRTGGFYRGETPEDVAIRHLGDPDKAEDREERQKLNKLICRYLSASIDASTWLGWYLSHNKRG